MRSFVGQTVGILFACSVFALPTSAAMAQDATKADPRTTK